MASTAWPRQDLFSFAQAPRPSSVHPHGVHSECLRRYLLRLRWASWCSTGRRPDSSWATLEAPFRGTLPLDVAHPHGVLRRRHHDDNDATHSDRETMVGHAP